MDIPGPSYGSAPIILNAVNDTLIFIAISYRILMHTAYPGDSWWARAKLFFTADGLPRLSKALLQGGQLYYFATIGLSIVFAALSLSPNIPPAYHAMLSIPNLALENSMACRVFRAVKLGFIKDHESSRLGVSLRSSSARGDSGHELAFKRHTLAESRKIEIGVDIVQTMDSKIHDDRSSGKRPSLVEGGTDVYDKV